MAQELLSSFDLSGKLVLADKGYDSDKLADWIKNCGGIAVIPSRHSARHPRKLIGIFTKNVISLKICF